MDADVVLAGLITSKTPVIISAPPTHDSQLSKDKDMFCNLAINYLGPNKLPNLSATHIKKSKSKMAAPIDINREESNSVEEVPKNQHPKSTAASGTKLIGVFPPSRPLRTRIATTSQAIVLSDSLTPESESSRDDHHPDQESRDVDTDMDMEGGEVTSEKSTAEDIDSEYEQELWSCKHKAKESQVRDSKQKGNVPSLGSKGQASKRSKTVSFNIPKAHAIGPKTGPHIPSSPTYVSSEGDVGKVERPVQKITRTIVPGSCEGSANAMKVVSLLILLMLSITLSPPALCRRLNLMLQTCARCSLLQFHQSLLNQMLTRSPPIQRRHSFPHRLRTLPLSPLLIFTSCVSLLFLLEKVAPASSPTPTFLELQCTPPPLSFLPTLITEQPPFLLPLIAFSLWALPSLIPHMDHPTNRMEVSVVDFVTCTSIDCL